MLCQHSRLFCRQFFITLHRSVLVARNTSGVAHLASRPQPLLVWAHEGGGDCSGVRRHCRIVHRPLLCSTMTAAEQQDVPVLDRSQFTSTLQLKALRLDASRCQELVRALQGCVEPDNLQCYVCMLVRAEEMIRSRVCSLSDWLLTPVSGTC